VQPSVSVSVVEVPVRIDEVFDWIRVDAGQSAGNSWVCARETGVDEEFPVPTGEHCNIPTGTHQNAHVATESLYRTEDELLWRSNRTSFPAEYWSYPQRRGHEVVGTVVAFVDITERKLAEAALANMSLRLIEAQEQERTRIGRELHDDIGQRLALSAIELEQLQQSPPNLSEVPSRMGELRKQTSEIAADIQSLSHELYSAKLQYLGIAGAMRGFCQEFGEHQKVEIDFHMPSTSVLGLTSYFFAIHALHHFRPFRAESKNRAVAGY
jgi:signal transduction histidine kinase